MEFRDLLLEELDFIQQARRQDAFRRSAAGSRKKFFSAPRIHLDLTTEEVVINEFASGIWLWELLTAVEQGHQDILRRAEELNIDPKVVAKRLLWVNYWSWGEDLFFHADPNPDNVIVGVNGTLFFINFTSTGTLNRAKRQALRIAKGSHEMSGMSGTTTQSAHLAELCSVVRRTSATGSGL